MRLDPRVLDELTVRVQPTGYLRVTRMAYAITPLGMGYGATRFASPNRSFQLLYLSADLATGIAETMVRDRFQGRITRRIAQEDAEAWGVTVVSTTRRLALVDLRKTGLIRLGVSTDAARAKSQRQGRKPSQAIHDGSDADPSIAIAGGFWLQRARVMDAWRIEVVGASAQRGAFQALGCNVEIINYQPRLFCPVNRFLERHALQSQQAGATTTYLALQGEETVGFHSLSVGQIDLADAPERLTKGLARHPVPVMLLARMAVAVGYQGRKLGAGLLKDAMLRTLPASEIAGIRAFVVHAKDDEARAFHERFDFMTSPTDAYHLMLLMKDVRARVGSK